MSEIKSFLEFNEINSAFMKNITLNIKPVADENDISVLTKKGISEIPIAKSPDEFTFAEKSVKP